MVEGTAQAQAVVEKVWGSPALIYDGRASEGLRAFRPEALMT